MKRILPLVLLFAACGGSGYDGPGKALVGKWDGETTLEYTMGGEAGSLSGYGVVEITVDGDQLVIEDGSCAYFAQGDGDDALTVIPDDGCVRGLNETSRLSVTDGQGSMNGSFLTIEISGSAEALGGGTTGTFSFLFRGEAYEGGGGEEGGGPSVGGGDSGSTGG